MKRKVIKAKKRKNSVNMRMIELGWFHNGRQVRLSAGGGKRMNRVLKSTTKKELSELCLSVFKEGLEKRGLRENFKKDILDYKKDVMAVDVTVGDILDALNTPSRISFYLSTTSESYEQVESESEQKAEQPFTHVESECCTELVPNYLNPESADATLPSLHQITSVDLEKDYTDCTAPSALDVNLKYVDYSQEETVYTANENMDESIATPLALSFVGSGTQIVESQVVESQVAVTFVDNTATIKVNRTNIQQDMINAFKSDHIINASLRFLFQNELGQDADGVSRDAYCAFWKSFFISNADGERSRVPILTPEYGNEEWSSIGRILAKGFIDHKFFPSLLSKAYAVAMVFGEVSVMPELLKESFYQYLSEMEAGVVQSALKGDCYDNDTLLDIFDRAQCHTTPNESDMLQTVLQVAHKVIIQESKYALDAISEIVQPCLLQYFATVSDLIEIYDTLKPTHSRLIGLLQCTPITKEENEALGYLKRFIRGRSESDLKKLLHLLTGADVLCVHQIDVQFVVRHGASCIPTIHTCCPMLELPSNYLHYPDFRSEWEHIIGSKDNLNFSVA